MIKFYLLLIGLPLFFCYQAKAQEPEVKEVREIIEYASPSVEGQGRSRGIIVAYERLPQFAIDSNSDDARVGNGNGQVRRNNKFEVRAFAPILNKPQTKLIFGFNYEFEEFNFENINPATYSLYNNLEDKNLKSIGAQLAYLHSIDEEKFYLVRVKGELNGDYTRDNISIGDYLKTTVDVAYGWKKSPYFAWGIGAQFGYTFGRRRVYPGVLYNRTFNDKWGVESIFPANARVRYNVSEKTLLYAGYRLEGASYNLFVNEPPLSQFGKVELRRTDVKGLVRVEQEIHDFLWFAVEGGFRQYYRNRVYEDIGSTNELIDNDLAGAGYIRVELYAVPPRKLLEKSRNR
ncbi:DUF6268 family outer membrane beta-barrel protein [Pontibacter silvestris]|uniref:DUF6268 family outer membrane beta-barrel protein n=1 Tax=Pontibacter silvestris TaxID=2305183 RepID=A0ABW4X4A6_9BACT|nr:DUF6268 family outer membrane beta-barrel protein [Pontibacter silvestris]MCC9137180.1 DUF6268 family outer membrane beta-barrel protein [Pontibacter silvestris]